MSAFLNVESSATGRRWVGPDAEADRLAEAMTQQSGLPLALCRVMVRQGVTPADVQSYLAPSLRDLLPDPLILRDMSKAAARFIGAVKSRQRIAIFGDYDVDGGSSSALLIIWLRAMGLPATLYIPDRIDEGYGPNPPAMQKLAAAHDLIICVDCGTLSHEAILAARGTDVLVLDHHLGAETLPEALAVVNPNRQDETGELAHLCAASVVFLMLVEANRLLRQEGVAGPDLMALLDLVALATVADVAPLIGVNRAFVRQGLRVMARRDRAGLRALADVARMDRAPTSYHLGFLLGPRVNAGGRIGEATLGARLLATDDPAEAEALAARLDALNTERRDIETRVREAAMAQAEGRGLDAPLVWAAGENWHPGVVGIVAARLKEATNRPAVVIGLADGEGKGSGRSVVGIDLGASIHRVAQEGLLLKGGGHKMAAGLTVEAAKLEPAMDRLSELLERQGAGRQGPSDLRLDGLLMAGGATMELAEKLELAGPYGAAAPSPRFAFPAQRIVSVKRLGESHLRFSFADSSTAKVEAICFGAFDGPLGPLIEGHKGRELHLAGGLEINDWGGRRSLQFRLQDASIPS